MGIYIWPSRYLASTTLDNNISINPSDLAGLDYGVEKALFSKPSVRDGKILLEPLNGFYRFTVSIQLTALRIASTR